MNDEKNNGPLEILRDGSLKITIWRNEGEKGVFPTAVFSKTYEKDGELRDGHSYLASDLLRVSELSRRAYHRMCALRGEFARQAASTTDESDLATAECI